jgi:elongation factor G
MRPYRKGEGYFNFVDGLRGDAVRRQFVPSVEKGCRAIMEEGILTGSPVIWVEVEFFDGKDHPVDGKDMAFQKAAKECFKKCFLAAGPALLEPMVNIDTTFPTEFAGEVSQYLNSHRGRIQGMEHSGEEQTIRASIPLAEIQTFSSDLRSMTQGQGSYAIEPAGFEQVPAFVQQQIIEKQGKKQEEE